MPELKFIDRAKETTETTGEGPVVLGGASNGFVALSGIGNGNSSFYVLDEGSTFEVGRGTYNSGDNTFSRDTVLSSSNDNNKISLGGTATIFLTYPADFIPKIGSSAFSCSSTIAATPISRLIISTGLVLSPTPIVGQFAIGVCDTGLSLPMVRLTSASGIDFSSNNTSITGAYTANDGLTLVGNEFNTAGTGTFEEIKFSTTSVNITAQDPNLQQGDYNVSVGFNVGYEATGNKNVLIGRGAGTELGGGSNNIELVTDNSLIEATVLKDLDHKINIAHTIIGDTASGFLAVGDVSKDTLGVNLMPAATLDVISTASGDQQAIFRVQGSEGELISINNNLSTGVIFSVSDVAGLPLIAANASGDVTLIENGRYVGIATGTPQYQLDVAGTGNFANGVRFSDGTIQTTSATGDISIVSGLTVTNATNIASTGETNAASIATNATNISTNTTNIASTGATLALATGVNQANIATNTTNIATNVTNIAATGASNYNLVRSYIDTSDNATFNNLTAQGNLTVSGTLTYIDSTTVTLADKQLELASNSGTAVGNDVAVNDGGIVVKSTDGDKKWTWQDSTDAWHSTENISLASSKSLIFGDGSTQSTAANTPTIGSTTFSCSSTQAAVPFSSLSISSGLQLSSGVDSNFIISVCNTGINTAKVQLEPSITYEPVVTSGTGEVPISTGIFTGVAIDLSGSSGIRYTSASHTFYGGNTAFENNVYLNNGNLYLNGDGDQNFGCIQFGDGTWQCTSADEGNYWEISADDGTTSTIIDESEVKFKGYGGITTFRTSLGDGATIGIYGTGLQADIDANSGKIDINSGKIDINSGNIDIVSGLTVTNATDITTNAACCAANEVRLDNQLASINGLTTNVLANSGRIDTNSGNIITNASAISTNSSAISTNSSAISTNSSSISTNVTNIAANSGRIDTNSGNIAANSGKIDTNSGNIDTVSGLIQTYTAGTGLTLVGNEFNTCCTGNFKAISFASNNGIVRIGDSPTEDGSLSIHIGDYAGAYQGDGAAYDVNVGYYAGYQSSGDYNITMGYAGGYQMDPAADYNVAIGYYAGYQAYGDESVYIGYKAGYGIDGDTDADSRRVAIGSEALLDGWENDNTVAIGYRAGHYAVSGYDNVSIGDRAGAWGGTTFRTNSNFATYQGNTAIGHNAFYNPFSEAADSDCLWNTAVGYQAGYQADDNGDLNFGTFLGARAGYNCEQAYGNTAVGLESFRDSEGSYNTAVGYQAGRSTTNQDFAVSLGYRAGYSAANLNFTVDIGYKSCQDAVRVYYTSAIGYQAGRNADSDYSIFLGYNAGAYCVGDYNIELVTNGASTSILDDLSNKIHIENTIVGDTSAKKLAIGNVGVGDVVPDATLEVKPSATTDVGLIVQGATSQSANLTEWQDSSETVLAYVDKDGSISGVANFIAATGIVDRLNFNDSIVRIGDNAGDYDGTASIHIGSYAGNNQGDGAIYAINIGRYAGYSAGGDYNTAIGYYAGYNIEDASDYNVAIGYQAGYTCYGDKSVYIGYQAGYGIDADTDSTSRRVVIGDQAMMDGWEQDGTIALGYRAGYASPSGFNNVFMGYNAAANCDRDQFAEFKENVAIGWYAMYGVYSTSASVDLQCLGNVGIGKGAGYLAHDDTHVNYMTMIGNYAGYNSNNAYGNTAIGATAFYAGEGVYNTNLGYDAGRDTTNQDYAVHIGYRAGYSAINHNYMVAIGFEAARDSARNYYSTMIGFQAGEGSDADYSIFIGGKNAGTNCVGDYNIEIVTDGATTSILDDVSNKINIESTIVGDTSAKKLAIGNVGVGDVVPDATLEVKPSATTDVGLIVQGASSHTANLTEWQNSSETVLAYVDVNGSISGNAIKTPLISNADGATITFDLDTGNTHAVTLGDNRTLAISNESPGQKFMLRLVQDATGGRTVTWFSTIKWAGGSAPTLTATANKADVFGFLCTGTDTYDGFVVGQNI